MNKHTAILGETQSGKTLLADHLFQLTGGLFIDIEDKGDIHAKSTHTRKGNPVIFRRALRNVKTVKYIPSPDKEKAIKEIKWIWKTLMALNQDIHVYVDEIQNYGGSRKNACDVFAIRGLKYGVHLNSITQRLANLSKTIATQSPTIIFFDISNLEKRYFKEYQLPYDTIKAKHQNQPPHHFVVYHRKKGVTNPYRLNKKELKYRA